MPVILYCRLCDIGYGSVGDLPVHCPNCGKVTRWGYFAATQPEPA